jgi:hypothetical protein
MGKTLVGRVGAVEERRSTDRAWKKPELSTTVEPGTTRRQGVEKGQRRPTRQGGADPRRLNNNTGAQGKKREGKREDGDGEGVRDGRTRRRGRGEEGEDKVSPPSPGQNRTGAVEEPHWKVEGNPTKKQIFSQEREESFRGGARDWNTEVRFDDLFLNFIDNYGSHKSYLVSIRLGQDRFNS